jgi:ribosome biogenesis GTPase A
MDTANNIIVFPGKNVRGPQTIEEVAENMDMVRQVHIQETLEVIMPIIFESFSIAGFQPEEEEEIEYMKHGAMIVEAARSFLCKVSGLPHPLQLIAENLFEQIDEEGNLEVSDKVKIVITPNEGKS